MKQYVVIPILALLLVVVQMPLSHLIFMGRIGIELTLLLVIYAGFYGDFVKGGMLSLVLGFVLDSLTNVLPGFFVFFYMTIFFVSILISTKVFPESTFFVAGFCFSATFAEGLFVTAASRLFYGNDVSNVIFSLYLPQSIVLGALSPAFFMAFNRVEALLDGKRKEFFTQL